MSETTGLGWLAVGETVAYVAGGIHSESVRPAVVEKIGKRDVQVRVGDRVEKFNITKTSEGASATWLYRRGGSAWERGVHLAPANDPHVIKIAAEQRRTRAADEVMRMADKFQRHRDVDTARKLRSATDAFPKLHDDSKD
ncbi:hypothetical protein [Nocardia wallacei]|uniref:hypothetical protein n=1 Tax=Nocardia wallacei TaxID=480035 RepID=UPI002457EC42|nr:hypothetical protein [Nocardia wallacei]